MRLARILLDRQFIRFLVVGVGNTAFGYAVFAAVYLATDSHRVAITIATIIGIAFNFFTTGRLVFGNRESKRAWRFVLGYAATFALNMLLLEILVRLGTPPLLAQFVALLVVVPASFLINRHLVFRG